MSLLAPPIACIMHTFFEIILLFGGKKIRNKISNRCKRKVDENHLILIEKNIKTFIHLFLNQVLRTDITEFIYLN